MAVTSSGEGERHAHTPANALSAMARIAAENSTSSSALACSPGSSRAVRCRASAVGTQRRATTCSGAVRLAIAATSSGEARCATSRNVSSCKGLSSPPRLITGSATCIITARRTDADRCCSTSYTKGWLMRSRIRAALTGATYSKTCVRRTDENSAHESAASFGSTRANIVAATRGACATTSSASTSGVRVRLVCCSIHWRPCWSSSVSSSLVSSNSSTWLCPDSSSSCILSATVSVFAFMCSSITFLYMLQLLFWVCE
mmetsp:Transcript_17815/g.34462  ORF Transcript_17815/g.34462 Transcript_17815/m.34462 type:complete len:259 (-) Transcript_17815:217-993(-)